MSRYSSDNVLGGIGSPSGVLQAFKSFGSFLQLGIEAADAEPDQCCFDSVDDPTLLSDEALAVWPLAIFVLNCRDCDHLAVITLAAQPAKKGTFEPATAESL
jgi:hypothetical protein